MCSDFNLMLLSIFCARSDSSLPKKKIENHKFYSFPAAIWTIEI